MSSPAITTTVRVRYGSAGLAGLLLAAAAYAAGPTLTVQFSSDVRSKPYTGRVYVVLSSDYDDPIDAVNWWTDGPIYAQDVVSWKPETPLVLQPGDGLTFGEPLEQLPAGTYHAQAVLDLNPQTHSVMRGPGNGYSPPVQFVHHPSSTSPTRVELVVNHTYPHWELRDTADLKFVKKKSSSLTTFFDRNHYMRAIVALPDAYMRATDRRFPTVYVIGGFGSDMRTRYWLETRARLEGLNVPAVVVFIDADCPLGHHVFADSKNNGPVGTAFVKELIPWLEQEFRLIRDPNLRLLTGHSSGGWSSLWLQVRYPEAFGGTWSTSPDPVDFSAFQTVNIYEPGANMFYDGNKKPVPVSRPSFRRAILAKRMSDLERVIGRGGQLQSFEAVFSPRGPDGRPRPLWDRETGAIDSDVAETWREYDIRHYLVANWKQLGPQLRGKLHLYCGDRDTFYLDRAFVKLRQALEQLESDALVEIIPNAGHGLTRETMREVHRDMANHIKRHLDRRREGS